jgi:hypothetical protein
MVIEDTLSTSISFYRMVPIPSGRNARPDLKFEDELLACDKDDAPDYSWRIPGGTFPSVSGFGKAG